MFRVSDVHDCAININKVGVSPKELHLVVNTHYHSDHVGGNFYFQENYGVKIAAHKWEAELINSCDPEACSAEWLDLPVEPYRVDRKLSDNEGDSYRK